MKLIQSMHNIKYFLYSYVDFRVENGQLILYYYLLRSSLYATSTITNILIKL